jgi:hypothetical protein
MALAVHGMEIWLDAAGPFRGQVTVETERIDITSGLTTYKPDPQWTFVDKAGHWHAFTADGKHPTMERYVKMLPCPGGCNDPTCEGQPEERYRCLICGKRIRPNRVVASYAGERRSMPGLTSWSVRVFGSGPIPSAEKVVVRFVGEKRTRFGLASPAGYTATSDSWELSLYGVGELGERAS